MLACSHQANVAVCCLFEIFSRAVKRSRKRYRDGEDQDDGIHGRDERYHSIATLWRPDSFYFMYGLGVLIGPRSIYFPIQRITCYWKPPANGTKALYL